MKPVDPVLIGAASAFSGDRWDAAPPVVDTLIRRQRPSFLIYETLAERTLALGQLAKRKQPDAGYDPWLEQILQPVLARCLAHKIRIVGNFGSANPRAAALRIREMAKESGLAPPRIAVVIGDDVSGIEHRPVFRQALGSAFNESRMVAANAYLGADSIADAIQDGADIVVTGRVADSSLTLGPLLAHYGWRRDDWTRRARGLMAGHLLECGTQITGGYFADPGFKDVPGLDRLGYPILEIDEHGDCVIGKADETGGFVTPATVKEQLLYEIDDPSAYVAPDGIADLTQCSVEDLGADRVQLRGIRGRPWPEQLKVLVCQEGGWLGEGEISYAGPRAEARARLAADIVRQRMGHLLDLRIDLIGVMSILADDRGHSLAALPPTHACDVRLRIAGVHDDQSIADRIGREVTALYTCGPAGGGGVRTSLRSRLDTLPCFLPRTAVPSTYEMLQ
ncbi:acyclic terpene utilization AtuA family protein [Ottowia thiooxydans]|uniref:acyclic terpene utilization AtuA family protein n=1 Tax=Ottowia thiooxydans TaxID=219182 RepID=UPI00040EF7E6|nr:acyclic terpene utilization AtuA family protein [Ottowia thiooxydans]